jgi:glutamine amidotransferase
MITIIDYGMGNIASIENMLYYLGVKSTISSDPYIINNAKRIILPGVGSFNYAIDKINKIDGLKEVLNQKAIIQKVPILGICLGMQLLTNSSEEGNSKGFGWISGKTKKFNATNNLKVPHMGWNTVSFNKKDKILEGLAHNQKYYFVHSYYVEVTNENNSLMKSNYGINFDSGISDKNIYGFQFHPEKSHKRGMSILKNFSKL